MRNYHLRKNTKWCPTLNLDKLWTLVSEQTRLKYKDAKPDGKVPVIDLVKAVSFFIRLLMTHTLILIKIDLNINYFYSYLGILQTFG